MRLPWPWRRRLGRAVEVGAYTLLAHNRVPCSQSRGPNDGRKHSLQIGEPVMNEPLHPFRWVPARSRKHFFLAAFSATLVLWLALLMLDKGLQGERGPLGGIVALQLAGSLDAVGQLLALWGGSGKVLAAFQLGIDYLFIVLYTTAIALGCAVVLSDASQNFRFVRGLCTAIAWGVVVAGMLDALENAALIKLLVGPTNAALPLIATTFAALKFLLLAAAIIFLVCAKLVVSLGQRNGVQH